MKNLIDNLKPLTRKQILALPVDQYEDYQLLSVCEYFDEIDDRDQEMAVYELILRSPEVSEMIAYGEIYFELVNYYSWKKEYINALQWCYAMIAFGEQHDDGLNRTNHRIDLANVYLEMGDFDVGLAMYARMINDNPGNVWLYNNLGLILRRLGLSPLAIEALDQGLKLVSQNDPYHLKTQFKELRDEAIELASSESNRVDEVDPGVLASFQSALQLPVDNTDNDEEIAYPPKIEGLLKIGSEEDITVYAEIIEAGQIFIPALIQLAYNAESETGSAHAIAILRTLRDRYPEELALLTPWLDQAQGNWRIELLSTRIGKIGGYTTQILREYAADTSKNTNLRTCATAALVERAKNLPELRDEIISFFRTLFTRPEAFKASEEQFIARLISDTLDLDARELYPEIKQIYEEDRLESGWIDLDDVHRKWDLARVPIQRRSDGLYLPVICKECGRKREHFSQYVLVDINSLDDDEPKSKYDAHILDHEVVCPKCGAVDQYEMTPEASLRMAGPDDIPAMFRPQTDQKPQKRRPNPRVLYFRSAVFGKTMHPLDGLDEYRRRIALNPNDALLHAKMGSLFRTLMRYPEALEAQRHAYRLAPDDPEVIIRLAFSEHDFGDREAARQLYQKIIDLSSGKGLLLRIDDNTTAAVDGLRNLKRNQPSPTEVMLYTSDGEMVEHPYMSWRQSQAQAPTNAPKKSKGKRKRGRRGRRGKRKKKK